MDASGHRFRAFAFATGLALCAAAACGGAVSTALDRPAALATVPQEASQGPDMNMDAGDEPVDDVAAPAKDSGPEGGQCGMCMFPMRCCMTPGAMYYGQCYNQFLCATCCL